MRTLLVFILSTIGYADYAQQTTFQRTFKAATWSISGHVLQTPDGGYIAAGTAYAAGTGAHYAHLAKMDLSGNMQWSNEVKIFGEDFKMTALTQTSDGGYVIMGSTYSWHGTSCAIDYEYLVYLRADPSGNILWLKYLAVPNNAWYYFRGGSVTETADGGLLFSYTASIPGLSNIAALMKTDASGNILWKRRYSGTGVGYQNAHNINTQRTAEGGFVILTRTETLGAGSTDFYLIKTDSLGTPSWAKTFGTASADEPRCVQQTTNGGYILLGNKITGSSSDIFIVRTDATGNMLWSRSFTATGNQSASSLQQTADGGFIICGVIDTLANSASDIFLMKTDSNGALQWAKTIGGVKNDFANTVAQTNDGGYVIGGSTQSFNKSMYVLKTDSLGTTGCNQNILLPVQMTPATVATTPPLPTADTFLIAASPLPILVISTGTSASHCPACPSPNPATVMVTGATNFCPSGFVVLSASPGDTYLWSSGANTQVLVAYTAGNYSVTISDSNGCISTSQTIPVTVFTPIVPVITLSGQALVSSPALTYEWYYNNAQIPGAYAQSYTPLQDGNYAVVTVDSNGCKAISAQYSFLLDIEDLNSNILSVHPNPTQGRLTLTVKEPGSVFLVSIQGVQLSTYAVSSGDNIITLPADTAPGVYILRFMCTTTGSKSFRLVYQPE
jgi:hypothetical protein